MNRLACAFAFAVACGFAHADPLVGEFRLELEGPSKSHKFWKVGAEYFYASCDGGQCAAPQPASLIDEDTLAYLFQPGERWKVLGAKGVGPSGGEGGLMLFHVDRPDERIRQRSTTGYLFRFWVLSGAAEKIDK